MAINSDVFLEFEKAIAPEVVANLPGELQRHIIVELSRLGRRARRGWNEF
ncbi:MAG: hypothetical protein KBA08_05885 [Firmicutes bacterium]|nr:hypothetical protein [Bacillota bacterium]